MAHHASTPSSVLDAPSPTVEVDARPFGATRQERRHGVNLIGIPSDAAARLMWNLNRNRNQPAVRADYRRGKKVRRHAREQS